ncbi:MAG: TIGR03564 family F420-dependent LLM class oxidoreductase [Acidimicrobiales bacterium]
MTNGAGGDRFGMRWGFGAGTDLRSVAEAREAARWADAAGFDGLWISHANGVDPVLAAASVAADVPNLAEVGTSVTPLYGRHPIALGQLVRSAQSALGGRFTFGVGASSAGVVAERFGTGWDNPLGYTREFLDALVPLLAGEPAAVEGRQITARVELGIDAPDTPILIAALGPKMLALAGARTAGTSLGQCGPKTIASYVAPAIREAAEQAGRPEPRIMALVRICVTDDRAGAYRLAEQISAFYAAIPSYAQVIAMEGLAAPADLHLIGSWDQVLEGLAAYGAAGATDLRIGIAAHTPEAATATREALAAHLSG